MRVGRNKRMALATKEKIKKITPEGQGRRRDAEAAGIGRLSDKDRERAEDSLLLHHNSGSDEDPCHEDSGGPRFGNHEQQQPEAQGKAHPQLVVRTSSGYHGCG